MAARVMCSRQTRVPRSSFSSSYFHSGSSSCPSPCSVLPRNGNPKPNKKRLSSPEPLQKKKKMIKLGEPSSSIVFSPALTQVKIKQLELKEREEKRNKANVEAEKERLEWIQRQRRSQSLALERIESVAKSKIEKPCCCSLKELGIIKQCHYAWSSGCWRGQSLLPLEQLGFVNKQGQLDLEEGEIP